MSITRSFVVWCEPVADIEAIKAKAELAAMKDRQDFEQSKAKADVALQKEKQDEEIALDKAKAKAQHDLDVWKAEQKAQLERDVAADKQALADMNFEREVARAERPNEPKLDAMSSRLDEFIARMSTPPKRRRLVTYRDENDNLVGEEQFVEDEPVPGPMMQPEGAPLV